MWNIKLIEECSTRSARGAIVLEEQDCARLGELAQVFHSMVHRCGEPSGLDYHRHFCRPACRGGGITMSTGTAAKQGLNLGFLYNIGDVVTHRGYTPPDVQMTPPPRYSTAAERSEGARMNTTNHRQRFFIVERCIVECPAGPQWLYKLRALTQGMRHNGAYVSGAPISGEQHLVSGYIELNEVELMPWAEAEEQDARVARQVSEEYEASVAAANQAAERDDTGTGATGSGAAPTS